MMDTQTVANTTVESQVTSESVVTDSVAEAPAARWTDSLPEHLKTDKEFAKFESLEKALESDISLRKLMGKRVQDLSYEDITRVVPKEDLAELVRAKELPADKADYKLPTLEGKLEPAFESAVKEKSFELGITPDKAEAFIKLGLEEQSRLKQGIQDKWQQEIFTQYGSKVEEAQKIALSALKEFDTTNELPKLLKETGLGDSPALFNMLVKIGTAMQEQGFVSNKTGSSGATTVSPKEEVAKLFKDPVFYNRWKNGGKAETEKVNSLYSIRN